MEGYEGGIMRSKIYDKIKIKGRKSRRVAASNLVKIQENIPRS